MFFRINEDRFKISSVTRFSKGSYSIHTKKYYLSVWFGIKERQFVFETVEERDSVVAYLDSVFKVQVI